MKDYEDDLDELKRHLEKAERGQVERCAECGKWALSYPKAHAVALSLQDETHEVVAAYPCPHGAGWHVGHQRRGSALFASTVREMRRRGLKPDEHHIKAWITRRDN